MKTISCILVFIIISGWSCNSSSGNSVGPVKAIKDDSLEYYPPTPALVDQVVFRRYFREISHYFDSTLLRRGFSGGILVAKDGAVLYERYAGFADPRSKDPFTDSTSTHIASSGKTFTGMAILRMVQENKLSLDDPLEKFFPGFPYAGVTVKMLLNHRSGMPNYLYFMPKKDWKDKQITNTDVLNYLMTSKPNRTASPDRRFAYSNTNYVLLALIIEKISGKSFPEFMKWQFFEPLGMTHTFVYSITTDTTRVISSYEAGGRVWANDSFEGTYGDKNVYTTPKDLLKWDQAFYTDQIIRKTLLDTAFTPYSNERPSVHNYGLGWRLLMIPNGKKVVYHNGRWHGFNAAFARLIDEKVTIIILGNKFNSKIYSSARLAYDIFGHYKQGPESEDEEENNQAQKKTAAAPNPKIKNKG